MDTNSDIGLPGGNGSAHWYDTWDRQTSQTFTNTAKGLRNAPGENNCFLNSAVQVFWHIDVFRRSYRRLSGHLCMGHSCIFCALKVIFTQFQYSDQSSLQPSALRKALANTFAKQERFQLGHMDDAAECFENILNRIHYHIANSYNEDACNAQHCIPHQKFAMTVFDQLVCPCGAQSDPHKFYEMVHYISANALVSQSRTMQENGDMLHPSRFGLLLRTAGAVGDVRDCPGNCGKRVQIRRTLLNVPDVVSIGLVWGSDKADPELAAEVTRTIGTTILYPDMFHSVMCKDVSQLPRLQLTAVVCYYGKHYSSFIYHTKLQEWIYFDDATVRQVGPHWEKVVERIIRSRYQPLLLIYTNPNASPVPTETAPSTRVMAPGFSMTAGKGSQEEVKGQPALPAKSQSGSRLSSSSSDRTDKESLERSSSFEHRRQSSFMLAVTKQKSKEEAIYAVPHNNTKVMDTIKDMNEAEMRAMYIRQCSAPQFTDNVDGQQDPDGYNYTLSNSDQYRRPSMNNMDHNKLPLTQNFLRGGETQRKESFKKGKGKVQADVIRYHVDGTRRTSQSSDSDQNSPLNPEHHAPTVSSNKPALPAKPKHAGLRSQSFEEHIPGLGDVKSSHKIIKPQATNAPMYDNVDSVTRAHTPVQSGLATLPRNKKSVSAASNKASSSTLAHPQHRTGSQPSHPAQAGLQYSAADSGPPPPYSPSNYQAGYQSCLTYQNVVDNDMHSRQSSNSSILSQNTVVDCSEEGRDSSHNRQQSTASQDTLTDKPPKEVKGKSKRKEKDEKKKEESKQKKEEKRAKTKKEKSSKSSDKPPPVPDKKGPGGKDEGFSEDKFYINSSMVESVLSFQKLQRSGSCVSQASTSSLESDNRSIGITPKDNLSSDIPFDSASLDSHKDSGYGSSDRNSSSSTGSITMNPYEQYFLSRNMIPPKTINHQAMAENMKKLMDEGPGMTGLEYTKEKDLKALVTNPNEFYRANNTVAHCSQVKSGLGLPQKGPVIPGPGLVQGPGPLPKDLMSLPKAERDQHLFNALKAREKGYPLQQPPSIEAEPPNKGIIQAPTRPADNGVAAPVPGQLAQLPEYPAAPVRPSEHRSPPSPEGLQAGNDQFIGLCQTAEDHMDSCVLAETSEQYGSALGYCQLAIDHLKQAMRMPNLGQTSYTYAQRKSNACIIKLRSLQKRLMARQESNNSTNSSDSGTVPAAEYNRSRQHKAPSHLQVQNTGVRPPSRSGSQNSVDSLGSARSSTPVFDKVIRPAIEERVPSMEPHRPSTEQSHGSPYKDRSFETNVPDCNSANNADLYGTLPRRKTQKSQDHTRQCNNQKMEADVYQDFLDNQRRQSDNVIHSRTGSGARTPVNEPSSDLIQHTGHGHNQCMPTQSVPPPHSVVRPYPDHTTGFTYSRMSQGLKPIPVTPPKIEKQSQHTESQPDLRALTSDSVNVPQRPLTPQVLCAEEDGKISVRDLKSRFESTKVTDTKQGQSVDNKVYHSGSQTTDSSTRVHPGNSADTRKPALNRQRSKSESESRAQESQKPKSVLSKKGKNTDRLNKPRKSVTFSKNICLVEAAAGDEWGVVGNSDHVTQASYQGDEWGVVGNSDHVTQASYQGDEEARQSHTTRKCDDTDSSTSDSPVEIVGEGACILCHKQGVETGQTYCNKCTYYMSRFTPQ